MAAYKENVKYAVELRYAQKQTAYETMIENLKRVKEKESQYKEIVDKCE